MGTPEKAQNDVWSVVLHKETVELLWKELFAVHRPFMKQYFKKYIILKNTVVKPFGHTAQLYHLC